MSLECEKDASGGQLPNGWEQYLVGQTDFLNALRSNSEREKREIEPPTETNQRIPQIRALIQDLEQAQWRRLDEIDPTATNHDTRIFLNSAKTDDEYTRSWIVLKLQAQDDEYLTSLRILKEEATALYLAKRASINMHFRGFARSLQFQDLPDEILSSVAAILCERSSNLNIEEKTGVQNFRLTCWRFCNASSHLLIHTLEVKMEHGSLSRLEEVSSHPTISKGVKMLQINLAFYSSVIAENIRFFGNFQANRLALWSLHMEDLNDRLLWEPGTRRRGNPDLAVTTQALNVGIDRCMAYNRRWVTFNVGNLAHELPDELLRPLILAHAEYKRRFEQQEILRTGVFAQVVAKALTNLPLVMSLEVLDLAKQTETIQPWVVLADPKLLVEGMIIPTTSENAMINRLGKAPLEQIVKLQLNFHETGIMLTSIHIHLSKPELAIGPALHEMKSLTASIQRLETFVFTFSACEHQLEPIMDDEYIQIGVFLSAILDTASLERLDLDFGDLQDVHDESPPANFGLFQLIGYSTIRKWKRIKLMHLDSIALTFEDLEELSNHVFNPSVDFRITKMDLLTGSWIDALDMIRRHCGPKTTLNRPYGRELESLPRTLTDSIFEQSSASTESPTPVDGYLRGLINHNPISVVLGNWENSVEVGSITSVSDQASSSGDISSP